MESGQVVSTRVRPEIVVRLEQLAAEADRTLAAEIRRAITGHLEATVNNVGENGHDITEE
jgi:predicted transcriptional regulator